MESYNGADYYAALTDRSVARFSSASAMALSGVLLLLGHRIARGVDWVWGRGGGVLEGGAESLRFDLVALSGAVVVYIVAGLAGHACFGEAADCMALNNYARADPAACSARLAMGVSLLASFPLMFSGLRSSLLALARGASLASESTLASVHNAIVGVGLAVVAAFAVATPNVSLIVGLLGAALGSILIYSLPPVLHLLAGAAPLHSLAGAADVTLLLFGLILAVLGTQGALSSHAATLEGGTSLPRGAKRAIESFANPGIARRLSRRLLHRDVVEQVVFPASLSREARGEVHSLAQEHHLAHRSVGKGAERFVVVSKPVEP